MSLAFAALSARVDAGKPGPALAALSVEPARPLNSRPPRAGLCHPLGIGVSRR